MNKTLSVLAVALLAAISVTPSAAAVGEIRPPDLGEIVIAPPCDGLSIDGIQECVNRVLDVGQGLVPCMENISVNDVQACMNWAIDYGQYWAEWAIVMAQYALELVCDAACDALA